LAVDHVQPSHQTRPVFTSDLSLEGQKEQVLKLISDFSERSQQTEDAEQKEIILARLVRLEHDLLEVESALKALE